MNKALIELNEIELRAERATPGPWWDDCGNGDVESRHKDHYRVTVADRVDLLERIKQYEENQQPTGSDHVTHPDADMEFIACARTDVPKLCNAVRILTDALGVAHRRLVHIGCSEPRKADGCAACYLEAKADAFLRLMATQIQRNGG